MVGILIKALVGVLLFIGSLVGGLAATGRLNHEGTANIPVLSGFFPEPEPTEGGEGTAGEEGHGTDAGADGHAPTGGASETAEGAHSTDSGHGSPADASAAGQDPDKPNRRKVGPSIDNPAVPKADGHGGGHGGGHGDAAGDTAHGAPSHAAAKPGGHSAGHDQGEHKQSKDPRSKAERDFERLMKSRGLTGYEPGAYFHFDGMPAGLTPEQLNEAWERVEGILQQVDKRQQSLDLRESELEELAKDISRRQKEVAKERGDILDMQRKLDAKIAQFEATVRLVRNDEVQKLKRTAETIAAFERQKAAELLQAQWATEDGQDEMLRVLEFMDKDAVNEILAELPNALVQDVLEKRMQVTKEAAPSGR